MLSGSRRAFAAACLAASAAGCAAGPAPAPPPEAVPRMLDLAEAERLKRVFDESPETLPEPQRRFVRHCAPCHGATGSGVEIPPDRYTFKPRKFSDGAAMSRLDDEHLFAVIKRGGRAMGLSPAMPFHGDLFTDSEIRELVGYLRTLARPARPNVAEQPGARPAAGQTAVQSGPAAHGN